MDVDLSTGLNEFPKLVGAIEEGFDIAIGSRLKPGAVVTRSFRRETISRLYNLLIKVLFCAPFSDAQCGFKAASKKVSQTLVPLVENNNWFFDTEFLIIGSKRGFKIKEIPVKWTEDPDSRVKILSTVWEDIKGLLRLRFGGIPSIKSDKIN
jgi:hypothetical protein